MAPGLFTTGAGGLCSSCSGYSTMEKAARRKVLDEHRTADTLKSARQPVWGPKSAPGPAERRPLLDQQEALRRLPQQSAKEEQGRSRWGRRNSKLSAEAQPGNQRDRHTRKSQRYGLKREQKLSRHKT